LLDFLITVNLRAKLGNRLFMAFEDRLQKIILRHELLTEKLSDAAVTGSKDFADLAKEQADLSQVYELTLKFNHMQKMLEDAEELITDSSTDHELRDLAQMEKAEYKEQLEKLREAIKLLLITKDAADEKGAVLEIRAGVGGDEAALFSAVLFNMYKKYAEKKGWKLEVVSMNSTGLDGLKEVIACIHGKEVYKYLKYESGVHRVQRIPRTESSGRIHTSTATIAILPEAEEVDLKIEDKDLRIDSFRGSGAGGQHVNTTDSAIRITHLPTGITVVQAEKSQHQNKAKAMKILRARIYEVERKKKDMVRSEARKGQVGTGDRSEKIRTYNYPQSRISDHRINFTSYNLEEFVNEGKLDEVIEGLIADDNMKKLAKDAE
jgi:peptide chain release factor 1